MENEGGGCEILILNEAQTGVYGREMEGGYRRESNELRERGRARKTLALVEAGNRSTNVLAQGTLKVLPVD